MEQRQTPTEQMVEALAAESDELLGRTLEREIAFGNLELTGKRLGDVSVRFCRYEIHQSGPVVMRSLEIGAPVVEDDEIFVEGEYLSRPDESLQRHANLVGSVVLDNDFVFELTPPAQLSRTLFGFNTSGFKNRQNFHLRIGFGRAVKHARHAHIDDAREFVERSMSRIADDELFMGLDQSGAVSVKESHGLVYNPTVGLRFNGNERPETIRHYIAEMRERKADLIISARRALLANFTVDAQDAYDTYYGRLCKVNDAILAAKAHLPDDDVDDRIVL